MFDDTFLDQLKMELNESKVKDVDRELKEASFVFRRDIKVIDVVGRILIFPAYSFLFGITGAERGANQRAR